jgi:AmpE protein
MTLNFLTIAICLLLLAALPELSHLRAFGWFERWLRWIDIKLRANGFWASGIGLAIVLAPIALILLAISIQLNTRLYGIFGFLLGIAALFYTLGPRDLSEDLTELAHAHTPEQRIAAQASFARTEMLPLATNSLIETVFAAALKRQFAPIFWFVCFGPAGALTYRLTQLLADSTELRDLPSGLLASAKQFEAALAWIPAQLMCLGLALASDFDAVAKAWQEHHDQHGRGILDLDLGFLSATAKACVDIDDVDEPEVSDLHSGNPVDSEPLQHAQQLIGRITMTWLVAIAMMVLTIYLA